VFFAIWYKNFKGEIMRRRAFGIFFMFGVLAVSAQSVCAAESEAYSARTDRLVIRGGVYPGGGERREIRMFERQVTAAAQGNELGNIAMRFSGIEEPSSSSYLQRDQLINEETGSGSWIAMLIAGFGVALISIVRRIRIIR